MLVKSTASRLAETNDLETLAAAADDDLQYQGRLRCPCATASAGGCTAEYFSDATIAKVVDETTFEEYIGQDRKIDTEGLRGGAVGAQTRRQRRQFGLVARACLAREAAEKSDARRAHVRQMRLRPVDHMKCSDLRAHHGQVNEDGSIIDNSCRRCGWFSAERQDWPIWDGKIHDDHKVNQKEEVELLASSLETAEAAAKQAQEKLELAQKVAARDARRRASCERYAPRTVPTLTSRSARRRRSPSKRRSSRISSLASRRRSRGATRWRRRRQWSGSRRSVATEGSSRRSQRGYCLAGRNDRRHVDRRIKWFDYGSGGRYGSERLACSTAAECWDANANATLSSPRCEDADKARAAASQQAAASKPAPTHGHGRLSWRRRWI